MVSDGLSAIDSGMAVMLYGEAGIGADAIDNTSGGSMAVVTGGIEFDQFELERRTAAIEDENPQE